MNIFELLLIQPLTNGLALFYQLLGNLGLSIIAFSLALRIALTPLTKPYMDSMKKMREFAPQIEKLKKKHGKDKKKLMEAQAQFYKEKGIKPGAGCLPYLLQIVVLIAFFRVFTRVLVPGAEIASKFNELLYPTLHFADGVHIDTHFLYLDLAQPDTFSVAGIPFALPGLFIILAGAAQLVSVLLSRSLTQTDAHVAQKTKGKEDDMQVAIQNSFVYTMPLVTIYAGYRLPSGLALYWLIVSLFNAVQQLRAADPQKLPAFLNRLPLLQSASNGQLTTKK